VDEAVERIAVDGGGVRHEDRRRPARRPTRGDTSGRAMSCSGRFRSRLRRSFSGGHHDCPLDTFRRGILRPTFDVRPRAKRPMETPPDSLHSWHLVGAPAAAASHDDAVEAALALGHTTLTYGERCFEFTYSVEERRACFLRLKQVGRLSATGSGRAVLVFARDGYRVEQRVVPCRDGLDAEVLPDIDPKAPQTLGWALLEDTARVLDGGERWSGDSEARAAFPLGPRVSAKPARSAASCRACPAPAASHVRREGPRAPEWLARASSSPITVSCSPAASRSSSRLGATRSSASRRRARTRSP